MDIEAIKMFSLLAKKLNYTDTAKALDISQPTLSRKIKRLESDLNVPLIHRRGNHICLTPQGEEFLNHGAKIVAVIDETIDKLNHATKGVQGHLRIGCMHPMAHWLTESFLDRFQDKYPEIGIHFHVMTPDTIAKFEDVDLVIAPIWVDDDTIVCRKTIQIIRKCYASPEYIKKHGMPKYVHDLELHDCITHVNSSVLQRTWKLQNIVGETEEINVSGKMTSNSSGIAINLAKNGHGVGLLPCSQVDNLVENGELVELFDNEWYQEAKLYLLSKPNIHTPERFKVFVDEFTTFHDNWLNGMSNT